MQGLGGFRNPLTGKLAADQVAAIVKYAPKEHDAEIAMFAKAATVS